jgi:hypothetical protein
MSSRDERSSLNQETFRSANEGMRRVVNVEATTRIPFLCECADFECLGRVEASLDEFEVIHSNENWFFILHGHPRIEGEEILSENDRYQVVSKAA